MLENNNKEIIKKLSDRSFKANKTRNLVSVIAIALTTILFTSLFTVGYSMLEAFDSYKAMEYGTNSHVQLQDVNKRQIEIIKKDSSVDKNSIGIMKNIGSLKNPEFSTQTVNLAVYDEKSLENAVNVEMIEGSLPKNNDEIVMPIEVLDMLKLPHKIGTEVKVIISKVKDGVSTDEKETFKFILSGYFGYKTATAIPLHDVYASEAFYNNYKEKNEVAATSLVLNFLDDNNLQARFDELIKKIQPYSGKASINPVYLSKQGTTFKEMIKNILPIILIIALILLSGYLLIYNIFYISVVKDIKYYGLLKTIGTSPYQLKKLIIKQANRLCIVAIPIGLVLGFLLGMIFVPLVGKFMDGLNSNAFEYFNPLIFVFAIVFSYITVRLSCQKPAKIVSSVSPIDAVRYSDKSNRVRRKSKKGRNGSKLHKMALSNLFRNKRKAILVLVSMSLSSIIFLTVSAIISSSNPEKAAEGMMLGDIEIHHGLVDSVKFEENDIITIDEKLIKDIKNIDGVSKVSKLYKDLSYIAYEGDLKDEILTQEVDTEYKKQFLQNRNPDEDAKERGFLTSDTIGLSSGELLSKLSKNNIIYSEKNPKILSGNIDEKKFDAGGYVVINGHKGSKIKAGDKIKFKYLKGKNIDEGYVDTEFKVMAVLDGAKNFQIRMYINENDFKNMVEKSYIQNLIIDVNGNMKSVEGKIKNLNEKYNNPYTKIYSKNIYVEEARESQKVIKIVGMSAVFIIGLIGVLNFINTMITNIMSRKQEFAMIEAVGMTKTQLKKMIILEGFYYGVIITIINLIFGSMATFLGFNIMKLRYSVYTYPVEALIISVLIVFLITSIVPLLVYHNISKDSIVDRIREAE
ncbi:MULTISPECIES: ABC transporter permease [Clostridioides]|uniref:ABC transporter permease n=1 Tax=Clostridioides sp. ZZV14-6387 TaxID=2811497 RepID=UPI0016971DD0|nr:ABC transporter permease [Clostridioides sp. ZZV14-6387]NJI82049.1 ABC transporter permease [Clostridioides difficile]